MSQPVVAYNFDAPKRADNVSVTDFCEKFIAAYRKLRNDTPADTKVKLEVILDKTTESTLYFVGVNKILRTDCPELIPCYTISRRK